MAKTSHSYFVVMQDYGNRGIEATVQPEQTRRAIVEMIQHGEFKDIVFVHHVDGLYVEDVTADLMAEAFNGGLRDVEPSAADALAAKWDHAADHRKHGERA